VFKKFFKKLATCCKPGCFSTFHFCSKWKSCQPVKIIGNLIDLSRHVVIDLSGCQPTKKTKKSCELVRNYLQTSWKPGLPSCQLMFPTSLQLVRLVECGLYRLSHAEFGRSRSNGTNMYLTRSARKIWPFASRLSRSLNVIVSHTDRPATYDFQWAYWIVSKI